ncbi:MAG TPA: SPOR domain-containing protein [Chitinophagales bacterium]|nr:SPOR domain-containing protein [Chitinophagales bacterium]
MKKIRNVITGLLLGLSLNFANAQQDPNNLFLVEVDNLYNTSLAGKVLGMPNIGDRSMSAEETLMYQILNCRWENGKWIRYTANPNGKGTIKVGHPFIQSDGNRVFFVSNIPGGAGGFDVYYSEKRSGKWSDPTNLGLKVNSSEDEFFPFITDAGVLQIYRNSTQVNFDLVEVIGSTTQLALQAASKNTAPQTPTAIPTTKPVPSAIPAPKVPQQAPAEVLTPAVQTSPVVAAPTAGVDYRIQLGSYSNPNWAVLNQLNDLGAFKTIKTTTGLTSVHLGSFNNLSEAQSLMRKVRLRAGFENAYVVGVENDKVVSVHK